MPGVSVLKDIINFYHYFTPIKSLFIYSVYPPIDIYNDIVVLFDLIMIDKSSILRTAFVLLKMVNLGIYPSKYNQKLIENA